MNEPIVGQASLAEGLMDIGVQIEDADSSTCLKEANEEKRYKPGSHNEATTNASDDNETNPDNKPPQITFKVLKEASDYLEYLLHFKITESLVVEDRSWERYMRTCLERAWDQHSTTKEVSWARDECERANPTGSSGYLNLFQVPRIYEEAQRKPCANIDRLALRLLERIIRLMHRVLEDNSSDQLTYIYQHLLEVRLSDAQVEYLDAALSAGDEIVESEWAHLIPFT